MTTLLTRPQKVGTETPLFIVSTHRTFRSASQIMVSISRMDGLPETDVFGDRLRSDRENWLTMRQVMAQLGIVVGALPRY